MKKTTIVHIILITAILVIAGISVYKLMVWNKGTVPEEAEAVVEQIDPEEFDIETLDMVIPMDASRLENHTDDGKLTVLCIGNDPFTDDRSETGLANLIAKKTGATVIDAAFPDSSTAYKNFPIDPNYPADHFNLPSLANVLMVSDFKTLNSALQYMEEPEKYQQAIEALESVDMEKVDVLVMMYDSTDYNMGTPCINTEVPNDVTAFTGGIKFFLDIVNTYWPHIRVFVMSPTYAQYQDGDGKLYSGTIKDAGNGPLPNYFQNELDTVVGCGYSFIDNYYGSINEDNYKEYMSDYKHYNEKGRELLSDRIADVINNKMTTVQSAVAAK